MIPFIDLNAQYQAYKCEIDERIKSVIDRSAFIMGPEISELEEALASFVGVKHCIGVSSGTMSLEIALRALGIGPGDEVITVPFTWISSAEVISLVGATPVFVDIEQDSYNMDPIRLKSAITPRTKAIMPVSLFGQMPNIEEINRIADQHGLPVIEDAAQSFGATRNGKRSCGASTIGSTSFFPAKPLGCFGDGGALFTDDDQLAEDMKAIRVHGGKRRHYHTLVGTNGRLDTLQAAILLAKLPHYPSEVDARAKAGTYYNELLTDYCAVPSTSEGNTHVYAQYTIRQPNREFLSAKLKDAGIPSAIYYPKCLHEQPVFKDLGYSYGDFPVAEKASLEVLSLPMHPFLGRQDLERIAEEIKTIQCNTDKLD